jgi:beta-glucanase (GH16 family)
VLVAALGCGAENSGEGTSSTSAGEPGDSGLEGGSTSAGDGDATSSGDGDGDASSTGDGDGDGDGDGSTSGDGATGDGDGTSGDGDGDGGGDGDGDGDGDGALLWSDEFDGVALDAAAWTPNLGETDGVDLVPGAWGTYLLNDGYAGYIVEANVEITGGTLALWNRKETVTGTDPAGTYEYTSGWIQSMHKVHYQYGYVEIRARFPAGNMVWPAFWTIAEGLVWCPEFDIAEWFGSFAGMGQHLCYEPWPNHQWDSRFEYGISDVTQWHTYGLDWRPGQADFSVDGVVTRSIAASYVPDEPMYFVLNNGVEAAAGPDMTTWPNALEVDYIRLYDNGETVSAVFPP